MGEFLGNSPIDRASARFVGSNHLFICWEGKKLNLCANNISQNSLAGNQ